MELVWYILRRLIEEAYAALFILAVVGVIGLLALLLGQG